jgi:hypothetical protein
MKIKIIFRKPLGNQDRFIISTTYKRTKDVRRTLETLKEMYVNLVNFNRISEQDATLYATACDEVAIHGAFKDEALIEKYDYATSKKSIVAVSKCKTIVVAGDKFLPEELRMNVYASILQGAKGIEYQSICDGRMNRYIQELNYRLTQYGRTLMALKNVGVFCAKDVVEKYPFFAKVAKPLSESKVLADQELPAGLAIGEFVDSEGNLYLLIQNTDHEDKSTKAFSFALKKDFRVYRVNPHDGKQIFSKESANVQKILIMPGDADMLRYQDIEEEACFIEYALKK